MTPTLKLSITRLLSLAEEKQNAAPLNLQTAACVPMHATFVSLSILNAQLECDFQAEWCGVLPGPTNWWASCSTEKSRWEKFLKKPAEYSVVGFADVFGRQNARARRTLETFLMPHLQNKSKDSTFSRDNRPFDRTGPWAQRTSLRYLLLMLP